MEHNVSDEIGGIYPEHCMMVSEREERYWRLSKRLNARVSTNSKINLANDLAVQSIRRELNYISNLNNLRDA